MSKDKINSSVLTLSEKIKPQLTVDKDGVFKVPDNIYGDTLPEGITLDIINKVKEHDSHFYAGAALAVGELSTDRFVEEKELKQTTAEFKVGGNDTFTTTHNRSVERKAFHSSGSTELITTYGHMRNAVTNEAVRNSVLPMSEVKNWLQEEALKRYGK
jgi:hypothetical protein